jgi:hypothetical protein
MANKRSFGLILAFHDLATLKNRLTYQRPSSLAGCHYNEEEISRHLKKKYRNQFENIQVCNQSNRGKTGRSCEGADSVFKIEALI